MNNVYYLLYITKKKKANKVKNTTKSKTNVLLLVKNWKKRGIAQMQQQTPRTLLKFIKQKKPTLKSVL